jgi:23S rRNA (uracil1939-C5)-methyltransferase
MELKVIDMDHQGSGITKIDHKISFVPKTITGDVIDADIYKEYKNYNILKLNKIITPSSKRINPICPYYNTCGGCNISNLKYEDQLSFKKDKVKNIFKKYLDIDINPRVIPSIKEYNYRSKITYHNDSNLGLVSIYNSIIDVDKCSLVSDRINELYNLIKREDISKLKTVTIKECDNGLMLIIDGKLNIDNIKDKCISIYENNKCIYHKEDGYIKLNNLKFLISDKSFFQINTSNITNLYDEIINLANFKKEDNVIDLYCGVGSISLYISKYVNSVLGIEIVDKAIEDAKENAKLNNIENTKFICGDVSKLINDNLNGNVIIVDPPRVGLDKNTRNIINNSNTGKLIYVSCDPMTLARDIKELDNYKLKDITLVDMFPQTHHVENVVILERK